MLTPKHIVAELFSKTTREYPEEIQRLPVSGSERIYFRLRSRQLSLIGAYNPVIQENRAFTQFTAHFASLGLPVPRLHAVNQNQTAYLLDDLGDTTLYSFIEGERKQNLIWSQTLTQLYKQALDDLLLFQDALNQGLDLSEAWPRKAFDRQSILWDLNYFKYYFVRLAGIDFDEDRLEEDFQHFASRLATAPSHFFMYRDFQSRNIMLKEGKLFYIDYQGGRRGPLPYDVASLLFDAKADIPVDIRNRLLEHYLRNAILKKMTTEEAFMDWWPSFVFVRIMQAMGAYGYRGFFQQKQHFLLSVPLAIRNLEFLLKEYGFPRGYPELNNILEKIVNHEYLRSFGDKRETLKVTVMSFSYRKGLPADTSGNGGGFIFDCRALPNPGREQQFKSLTGNHPAVIEYLSQSPEVADFFENCKNLILQSVNNYLQRGFTHLLVCFGCTGGQHRSVFMATRMAELLGTMEGFETELIHRELSSPTQVTID
ncbi:MAG: RapZ C-terminal domain-containing protein [Bacteroidales bacterium]